jgi:dolichyl-phosphate beta-glucosyltransferase
VLSLVKWAVSTPDPAQAAIDLSVVIPAYNEASRIESALGEVARYLSSRELTWEIIVADDGSTDQTTLLVQRFMAGMEDKVKLVRLPHNRGKGAALRAGVGASRGARVLMMDADLATPVEELATLERALEGGAAVVAGSRAVATSHITRSQSGLRVLLGRLGNLWIRVLAVPGIHDTQCGFKLFEGEVARRLFQLSREERFGIDIEILCLARRALGVPVAEVGVTWRHQDGSKVRWKDYVDVLMKVPTIAWSVARTRS